MGCAAGLCCAWHRTSLQPALLQMQLVPVVAALQLALLPLPLLLQLVLPTSLSSLLLVQGVQGIRAGALWPLELPCAAAVCCRLAR